MCGAFSCLPPAKHASRWPSVKVVHEGSCLACCLCPERPRHSRAAFATSESIPGVPSHPGQAHSEIQVWSELQPTISGLHPCVTVCREVQPALGSIHPAPLRQGSLQSIVSVSRSVLPDVRTLLFGMHVRASRPVTARVTYVRARKSDTEPGYTVGIRRRASGPGSPRRTGRSGRHRITLWSSGFYVQGIRSWRVEMHSVERGYARG